MQCPTCGLHSPDTTRFCPDCGTKMGIFCAQCGTVLPALGDMPAQCPKCGAALHSCQQCTHFDPSERFECRQPIPERIAPKDAANTCTFYEMRVSVERETTTGIGSAARTPADARKAFDNLFKK